MSERLSHIRYSVEELKLLGCRGSLYRIYHELAGASGLKTLTNPVGSPSASIETPSLRTWRQESPAFFVSRSSLFMDAFRERFPGEKDGEQILTSASLAAAGKIVCFSRWIGDYGYPLDWHRNPVRGVSWPSDVHCSKIMAFEPSCGDIKMTWELNRFPHIFALARAYALTRDSRWARVFCEHLISWEDSNTFRAGANWSSGQELAIRSLAWIFGLHVFGHDDSFRENDFQRVMRLLHNHAEHIGRNISFARYAVHNNHLIGEALGLFAVGSLFPWFEKSEAWKETGKNLLENVCLNQFYDDGGYCQLSHNYHRLALHYYLWACRIGECSNNRLSSRIYEILDRSAAYLSAFMNVDGMLPNWGANDGALLNPWTNCEFADFRPLLTAIRYLTSGKRAFPSGPWDEELLWFFGTEALTAGVESYKRTSCNFPVSGLQILRRDGENFLVMRCGTVRDRFAQADQLHVDIWWKGLNVAIDGGSYVYNDELQYHRHFVGTRSHNTVVVDGRDQMHLHRRFKWLFWTKASLLSFDPKGEVTGEHYGYERLKGRIVHRRRVTFLPDGSCLVKDSLSQKRPAEHEFMLHWLINDFPYQIVKKTDSVVVMAFATGRGTLYLLIKSEGKPDFRAVRADSNEERPEGWQARYYGEKVPALSISMTQRSLRDISFVSLFTEDLKRIEEFA